MMSCLKSKAKATEPIVNLKAHVDYSVEHEFPQTHLDMPVHTDACLSALELVYLVDVSFAESMMKELNLQGIMALMIEVEGFVFKD